MSNYTPPVLNKQMILDTHKFINGICVDCAFNIDDAPPFYGRLKPGAPLMFVETCHNIARMLNLEPYQNLPLMTGGDVPEFKEYKRPRNTRLKLKDGRYIKILDAKTYIFVRDAKEATIFTNLEELNYWSQTISKIWDMYLYNEQVKPKK